MLLMNHLPECHTSMIPDFHNERWICICAALRACEQRVEEAMDRAWTQTVALAVAHTRTTTLDAAREAVAGLRTYGDHGEVIPPDEEAAVIYVTDALAAIDALREKP